MLELRTARRSTLGGEIGVSWEWAAGGVGADGRLGARGTNGTPFYFG